MTRVIGIGAGGHARVVVEILRAQGGFELVGFVDSNPDVIGTDLLGVPILGDDGMLPSLLEHGVGHFFVGVGTIGNVAPRRRVYELALALGFRPVSAIHPRSVVSPSAELGLGATLAAGAIVNACARLGANVIVNTGSIVEHDCVLGDHVHVATGARLAAAVLVGEMAHIGAGATVRQGITIGERAVVGAGAVVVNHVPPGEVVVGVPAKPLKPGGHRG